MTTRVSKVALTMPPIIGAAIRFITSAPADVDHMIGSSPMNAAATVISFGRARFTAPWTIASSRPPASRSAPRFRRSAYDRSRKSSMKTPA